MAKKDPAFLFYSKDWIEGTAEMTSEEKGVYIDLLAHQHQKGDLPLELNRLCKLAGLSESDFKKIWEHLSNKFTTNSVNRLVNRKMIEVSTERSTKGLKNKITSAFAIVVRKCERTKEDKDFAKKGFDINDFINLSNPILTERLTEWFYSRLPTLEDANANAINNNIVNSKLLVPEMFSVFKKANSVYPGSINLDFSPLNKIATFLHQQLGLNGNPILNQKEIVMEWQKIGEVIANDKFYKSKSLSVISNQIQEIYQIHKNIQEPPVVNKKRKNLNEII